MIDIFELTKKTTNLQELRQLARVYFSLDRHRNYHDAELILNYGKQAYRNSSRDCFLYRLFYDDPLSDMDTNETYIQSHYNPFVMEIIVISILTAYYELDGTTALNISDLAGALRFFDCTPVLDLTKPFPTYHLNTWLTWRTFYQYRTDMTLPPQLMQHLRRTKEHYSHIDSHWREAMRS
ncbi:hypothetical protein LLE49_24720 [Alicyclobacillus tolerans]|uniref:hypothetical protein n=1 Tax=Alicyclobacillus tolerans TaxID=90970 RepID=UPI001F18EE2D|nr:hypothetical protein [Alicyclobacillus tolerans]MCF8567931.1 hypothetical protein [Alicyclobacillus tolerans]